MTTKERETIQYVNGILSSFAGDIRLAPSQVDLIILARNQLKNLLAEKSTKPKTVGTFVCPNCENKLTGCKCEGVFPKDDGVDIPIGNFRSPMKEGRFFSEDATMNLVHKLTKQSNNN